MSKEKITLEASIAIALSIMALVITGALSYVSKNNAFFVSGAAAVVIYIFVLFVLGRIQKRANKKIAEN
jgi:ABC-type amino acid transport system permease subunit